MNRKKHREHASLTRAVFETGCLLTLHQLGGTDLIKPASVRCKGRAHRPPGSALASSEKILCKVSFEVFAWKRPPPTGTFNKLLEGLDPLFRLQNDQATALGPQQEARTIA